MLFECLSLLIGILKISIYKIIYNTRIKFDSIPKINNSFRIAIKKGSKLIIVINLRLRYNVSFRIYNEGKVKIGNNCFFNDGCSINCQQNISIGDNLICGQNVMIFDHDHDYKNNINEFVKKEISIGNNVWIGANCIILKGVTIGDNVVIAAGTTVNKNIPTNTLIYQEKNIKKKEIINY